ncbi:MULTISPECIES: dienelactone hydrolase family protein [Legionella]|uniref:dienelactone hydrolase family protein n=1 Tax=Legionella TaxID=445 RepID=UPI000F8F706B|nr:MULTISPECIES: dienelactone hydrolase family protein [Legionella]MCP0914522.1 dienelactone hydrolase family protein [Legionella sp. 27cVA30]RUR02362.1 hypothetical protein ELY11_01130 [Legionella septentrionalis]RUR10305.1 hypothetical protein ELY14_05380 [Legionella septentrionalis]RUR17019.1 hypothetical protein ELY10_01330 [Legionella septentrionalis]
MKTADYIYRHDHEELRGFVANAAQEGDTVPAVLIVHDWSGRNEFACRKAEELAKLGYIGFAVDVFGQARIGKTTEEKMALMQPFVEDRALLRERLLAAFNAVKEMPGVATQRIAVIGFCFGGLCALDLARSGADIAGAVSFHGLLHKPENLSANVIKAKILALHGYDDPMVPPAQVDEFCQEMTAANVDWQVYMYGHTKHAFMNPQAQDEKLGTIYNPQTEHRAWLAMQNFLQEIFKR